MVHLLSPVTSYEAAVNVISSGADEIYCGVECHGIKYRALSTRNRVCSLSTYDELGKITRYAHDNDVKVLVTTEFPFISELIEGQIKEHISSCVKEGIDALILGDIGLILTVKKMGLDTPIYASTYLASMNYEAVDFLRKLGVERVILERHTTIEEIQEIVSRIKGVEIEVFVHGPGCSNININCYGCYIPPHLVAQAYWKQSLKPNYVVGDYLTPMCKLTYDLFDVDGDKLETISSVSVLDAFSFCSLCYLPNLIKTGVMGIKIVGRCLSPEYQEATTRAYSKLLNLIEEGKMDDFYKELALMRSNEMSSLAPKMPEICEQKRCFYSPLFHAPYKIPLSPKLARDWLSKVSG